MKDWNPSQKNEFRLFTLCVTMELLSSGKSWQDVYMYIIYYIYMSIYIYIFTSRKSSNLPCIYIYNFICMHIYIYMYSWSRFVRRGLWLFIASFDYSFFECKQHVCGNLLIACLINLFWMAWQNQPAFGLCQDVFQHVIKMAPSMKRRLKARHLLIWPSELSFGLTWFDIWFCF